MTDWELIVEQIETAMQAIDQAHEASENLRTHTTAETLDEFSTQMKTLHEHLSALQNVLEHSTTYTMDELVDALSQMSSGKPAAYRRTKPIAA